jgi:hypothetical protein
MASEERTQDLFDEVDALTEEARRLLNRFDQMSFATAEEAAEDGPELLGMLAGLGDAWDHYRQAHEALAAAVNDIYRELLA